MNRVNMNRVNRVNRVKVSGHRLRYDTDRLPTRSGGTKLLVPA